MFTGNHHLSVQQVRNCFGTQNKVAIGSGHYSVSYAILTAVIDSTLGRGMRLQLDQDGRVQSFVSWGINSSQNGRFTSFQWGLLMQSCRRHRIGGVLADLLDRRTTEWYPIRWYGRRMLTNNEPDLIFSSHDGSRNFVRIKLGPTSVSMTLIAGRNTLEVITTEIRTIQFFFLKNMILLDTSSLIIYDISLLTDSTLSTV